MLEIGVYLRLLFTLNLFINLLSSPSPKSSPPRPQTKSKVVPNQNPIPIGTGAKSCRGPKIFGAKDNTHPTNPPTHGLVSVDHESGYKLISYLYFQDLKITFNYFTKIRVSPHPSSLVTVVHHTVKQAIELVRHLLYLSLLNNQILLNLKLFSVEG